jgi:two-component system, OmpR family, phosphate regulon sensor histidine kinase PhoR
VALGYVMLRFPFGLVYSGLLGFVAFRVFDKLFSLVLIVPAAMALWGLAVTERAMASRWFEAELTAMAPERPPGRTWRKWLSDLLSNPVTWKVAVFAVVEAIFGFTIGMAAITGAAVGFFGAIGLAISFVVTIVVALIMGPAANVPPGLPLVSFFGVFACLLVLLATLYAGRWTARLHVWFVAEMLGMSRTRAALESARAEAATEHARADVADRSRRDLVLNVSHELRNPLATVRAHVDTLRGDGTEEPGEEDRMRYLDVLSRETDRMATLVDELLTLASADTGRLELEMRAVNAGEVATQVHDAMAPLAWRERHIRLLCDADGGPAVMADRGRLAQVLMNLVRNAITHTPEGGMVAIDVRPEDDRLVQLIVSDTGAGIEPEEAAKIFDRFYRTDESRSRATGGFGLGLAIAREMVVAMGGRITVDSKPGQGSRFTVTLARV